MCSATSCNSASKDAETPIAVQSGVTPEDTFRIPKPLGFVTDLENLFSDYEQKALDSLIRAYEKRTTVQIRVITFGSSYTSIKDFENFTLSVLNTWGVGVKGKNNGILIGICPDYRRIRIENGYGIEKVLSNEETAQIIQQHIVPSFTEGKYFLGVFNGIERLTVLLDQKEQP